MVRTTAFAGCGGLAGIARLYGGVTRLSESTGVKQIFHAKLAIVSIAATAPSQKEIEGSHAPSGWL
jgi:hypothetical protein